MKKIIAVFLSVFVFLGTAFAENEISEYTEQKVNDFVTLRVSLKSFDDEAALKIINETKEQVFAALEENAVDYEQEKIILENLYFMESYEHLYTPEKRAELRKQVKQRMKTTHSFLDKRSSSKVSKWYYVLCSDITNYYMTRSTAACILYGFKVRDWYKLAISKDKTMTAACASLANWNFYAPAPVGSNKRAAELYKDAIKGAKTPGEQYMAWHYYSQFLYEKGDKKAAAEYLQKCYGLELGTSELDFTAQCNKNGYSYLQHLRKRSGVDEKMPENEKDAEDK